MAKVDVSVSSDLTPDQAWKLASDLQRFDEWLTIFAGWRGLPPAVIGEGTQVSSLIKVKGFRNTIHWEVTEYDEPSRIRLQGRGRGGVHIGLTMRVADDRPGSTFHLLAELSGGLLSGPVGALVAKVITSDVRNSVQNLGALR
ncbi:type II toxin-antitoxin system Rv0910 family toxin [Mycolicibacterium diernhoferi]|uniref:Polyketide cyclase / dehydrase and lipid transport n=1 Tax=Mycolicibacterium diernhoferi TaxID=1801 RepID=A0A1Q4HK07_9MYCO|nr:SRPBCC family protein [Mycolicibacterium diernhoferi]OJZ67792.1 polyketide cyclase / dehydrase and lipid transport [Mycolicibacterium diernhoferi]OPE55204.1 polyketide cyclase / dehydrase and lipid transport [Mycolicibacterium diernhoferi]PEG51861.1 SRPBCC family protein [Mycolicibacterium diernhoferi]QYL20440.1 SRPBCC family protein [Mycolicibacterium diernhoferi]